MKINLKTTSAKQTQKVAKLLAQEISRLKTKKPIVLALTGDLGSGKTTFIQGFIKGLGIKKRIISPTFVIIKSYKLHKPKNKNWNLIYHIDCYRLQKPKELIDLGFKNLLNQFGSIFLIEWAEKIKKILPKNTVWLKFQYGEKENERTIRINPKS